jgi:DNA-binding PadR family transcriptional regulator
MKRSDPYIRTRGKWLHNELAWAVLAVLDVTKRSGYLPLTMKAIQRMTGANYYSLSKLLPKWVDFGFIKRYQPEYRQAFVKAMFTYRITGKGKRRMFRMEYPQQRGSLTFKPGVNRDAVLRRLPIFARMVVRK